MKLVLLVMALGAGGGEDALRAVARDRSPRATMAAVRSLAGAPTEELAALLGAGARLSALAPEPTGRERVEIVLAEALAVRRDPAAAPVLRAVFEDPERGDGVATVAARGLGRLCRDADLEVLAARARPDDPRDAAALEGLAACRRAAAATVIAARLGTASSADEVDRLARAAGRLGSSWAWQALGPAHAQEALSVRQELASALAAAEVRAPRASLAFARRMVGQPALPVSLPESGAGGVGTAR